MADNVRLHLKNQGPQQIQRPGQVWQSHSGAVQVDSASLEGWGAWQPQGPIHFKEDVLRVKRSRFKIVILSAAKDLSPDRDPSLRSG